MKANFRTPHLSCLILLIVTMTFFSNCTFKSYYQTNQKSVQALKTSNYRDAAELLNENTYLKEPFNAILYHLEKGRLLQLAGEYRNSNKELFAADNALDDYATFKHRNAQGELLINTDNRYTIDGSPIPSPPKDFDEAVLQSGNVRGSFASGSIPHFKPVYKQEFLIEDVERPMINYIQGMNALALNQDGAYTEARRLNILLDRLNTKRYFQAGMSYAPNPFISLLSGIFYEAEGKLDDALIAYEQAYKDFMNQDCKINYGIECPQQLKQDIVSLCVKLGIQAKYEKYSNAFNLRITADKGEHPELILFIEDAFVPHKEQGKFVRSLATGELSSWPTEVGPYEKVNMLYSANDIATAESVVVMHNEQTVPAAEICNLSYSIGKLLIDQANMEIKSSFGKTAGNKTDLATKVRNYETRHWQSLPAHISYLRIPLKQATNNIQIQFSSNGGKLVKNLTVIPKTHLQVQRVLVP